MLKPGAIDLAKSERLVMKYIILLFCFCKSGGPTGADSAAGTATDRPEKIGAAAQRAGGYGADQRTAPAGIGRSEPDCHRRKKCRRQRGEKSVYRGGQCPERFCA